MSSSSPIIGVSVPLPKHKIRPKSRKFPKNDTRIRRICYVCKTTFLIEPGKTEAVPRPRVESDESEEEITLAEIISVAKQGVKALCSYYHFDYEAVLQKGLEGNDEDEVEESNNVNPDSITLPVDHALCLPCMRHLAHVGVLSEDMEILTLTRLRKLEGLGQLMTLTRKRHRDYSLLGAEPPPPKKAKLTEDDTGDSDGDSLYEETNPWATFRKGIVSNYIETFGIPVIVKEPSPRKKKKVKQAVTTIEMELTSSSEDEDSDEGYNLPSGSSSGNPESESDEDEEAEAGEQCDADLDLGAEVVVKTEQEGGGRGGHRTRSNGSCPSTISLDGVSASGNLVEAGDVVPAGSGKRRKYINDLRPMDGDQSDSDDSITDHVLDQGRVKPTHLEKAKELKNHYKEIGGRLICNTCGAWITLKRISSRELAQLKMMMHVFNRHFPEYHHL